MPTCFHCNRESSDAHYDRTVHNVTPLYGPWAGWRMAGRVLISPDRDRISPERLRGLLVLGMAMTRPEGNDMARRKSDPTPWGFSAIAWQAFAFVLLGLLALTNAAWFYNIRVAKVEAAAAALAPEPRRVERVIYQTSDGRPVAAPRPRPAPAPAASQGQRPLASDEQCIQGTRFRVTGDTWTQSGVC
ncbi:MAG: hypothetical protein GX772_10235 [Alcaligenaceae bacterium]|nr:hypothetical protein [Alcaligenaceae bacterium]